MNVILPFAVLAITLLAIDLLTAPKHSDTAPCAELKHPAAPPSRRASLRSLLQNL